MKKVSIYSTPTCHFCNLAKEYFKQNNVAFENFNVAEDSVKREEMVERSGQMGVPVIIVDSDIVIGFNKPLLAQLLGIPA
ncbi:NrdH-redoxin [Candidatus Parcubacteria bacterium]|nr:NrdH-redoxin [Candidatus Parcubacteria bacterium]